MSLEIDRDPICYNCKFHTNEREGLRMGKCEYITCDNYQIKVVNPILTAVKIITKNNFYCGGHEFRD